MSAEQPLPEASRAERDPVVYRLDQQDRIIEIEGDRTLLSEDPTGKAIWRYVRGADVTSLYEHIRSTREARFPYRCDSPTHCAIRVHYSVCPACRRNIRKAL